MQQTEAVVSWRLVVKAQETAQKTKFFKSLSFTQCNTLPLSGSSHFKWVNSIQINMSLAAWFYFDTLWQICFEFGAIFPILNYFQNQFLCIKASSTWKINGTRITFLWRSFHNHIERNRENRRKFKMPLASLVTSVTVHYWSWTTHCWFSMCTLWLGRVRVTQKIYQLTMVKITHRYTDWLTNRHTYEQKK